MDNFVNPNLFFVTKKVPAWVAKIPHLRSIALNPLGGLSRSETGNRGILIAVSFMSTFRQEKEPFSTSCSEWFKIPIANIENGAITQRELRRMVQPIGDTSEEALFQLRLRQAVLAAQHSIRQVALLLIEFDGVERHRKEPADPVGFSEAMRTKILNTLRDSDTVATMPSGELAVLLPSANGPEDAALVAKKILNKLHEPLQSDGLNMSVHPRIGIALFPEHGSDAKNLLERADIALSAARRTGNSCVVYSQQGAQANQKPLRMSQLRQAIVADQLFLLYQPKISLRDGRISSVEVLTRWQLPDRGIVPPDEFIPMAERTGLINPLTLWVLHQALLQCRAWNEMGINVGVAVNLSMWNLDAQELPDQIDGLLKDIGVTPDNLELEITESAVMGDPERAMRALTIIRDLGVRFTIDDFGTGYSSLAYLSKLPVAGLKIDKSFVQNMASERDNAVIVRSIIDLGHNLGLTVVAEGVETLEAQSMLKAFDCDEAQGFYYSRPIPAPATTRFLKHAAKGLTQQGVRRELATDLFGGTDQPLNGKAEPAKL